MRIIVLIVFIFLITSNILPQEKVLRIIDGDTFELFSGEIIRLIGINAPEINDRYGNMSKEYLVNLIQAKDVILKNDSLTKDKDIYGRLLRYVYLNDEDINKKMILNGYALVYSKYLFTKIEEYEEAEQLAKNNKIGLWKDEKIIFPKLSKFKYFIIGTGVVILFVFLIYFLKK